MAQINEARGEQGRNPLLYDPRLELVGNAHCEQLISDGADGHFTRDGVSPYLRWLLAGGRGFHIENVGRYSSTGAIPESAIAGILARSVTGMLTEKPPEDGHRRALLDPWLTHIGVGLAVDRGELRMTHELATEVTTEWTAPPAVALPNMNVTLSGRLAKGWRPQAVEALWEPPPHALTEPQLRAIRSYGYPPRRAMTYANRPAGGAEPVPLQGAGGGSSTTVPFAVGGNGEFSYRWSTGAHVGVEIVLLWARRNSDGPYVPVAASATVVTASGTLPPGLAFWYTLGQTFDGRSRGEP